MPRNNSARMSAPTDDHVEEQKTDLQSILNFVIPTDFVEIPSKGKFYQEGHPLHNKETIEIKHISAREIDILTSESLLKKGVALDRMLQSIIIDQNIKIDDLLSVDKNALIVSSRVTSFGSEYGARMICQSCGKEYETEFDLNDSAIVTEPGDVDFSENGTFFVELPQTKVMVECRLLTSKDEKSLVERQSKKSKLNLPETLISDQIKFLIVSLNGVAERGLVDEFVDVMPAADMHFLSKEYEQVMPDVKYISETTCTHCGKKNEAEIPFTANFFWPDRQVHS
jgi:hypothetical protein